MSEHGTQENPVATITRLARELGLELRRALEQRDRAEEEIRGVRARAEKAEAALVKLAEAGTGYSQETVDALTKERDSLQAEVEAIEAVGQGMQEFLPLAEACRRLAQQSIRHHEEACKLQAEVERLGTSLDGMIENLPVALNKELAAGRKAGLEEAAEIVDRVGNTVTAALIRAKAKQEDVGRG